jgi:hypothetical protein
MEVLPPFEQAVAMVGDKRHRTPDLVSLHAIGSNQLGRSVRANEVDLGLSVPEDMDVSGFVIIEIDNDLKSMRAQDRHHGQS